MKELDQFTVERLERIIRNAKGVASPTYFEVNPADIEALARVALAVKTSKLNSPETPDGWVACSERVPECGQWDHATVIVSEGNNSFIAYYNKRDGKFLDEPFGMSVGNKVTHWMPLPAAPKPEK
ncbi:DUF551 domain-containing protein [Serratia fonticola]|uniref:DUF551 domain-containing protein n=1 Tax=Serratia fonticola TaxID=47917 RepID=UPI003AAF121B